MRSWFSRGVSRTSAFAAAAFGLALLSGCSPARGSLVPDGYDQTLYGFKVGSEGGSFLGAEWLLDSHTDGRPKTGGIYKTQYDIDSRGDGSYSLHEDQLTYDLRFRHRATNAILWLTTFPVSTALAETKLSVQMRQLVDNMAGGRFEAARIGQGTVVEDSRFATKIVAEGPATVAGQEAYVATVDMANVDQLKLDANHRQQRMRLVLVRTPFKHHVVSHADLPVYMVVGYASTPSEFDAQAPAIEKLLGRIIIQDKQGFLPVGAGKATPAEAAPPAAPNIAAPVVPAESAPAY